MSRLEDRLIAQCERGADVPLPEEDFAELALEVFRYQYERCAPYRALCRLRGASPANVPDWRDIPAVHTDVFKAGSATVFSTVPPAERRLCYRTTGTTRGPAGRGEIRLPDTRLYDASLLSHFAARVLSGDAPLRLLIVGPTAERFPQSSLGHMLTRVRERFGAPGSGVFWSEKGLQTGCLIAALNRAEEEGVPVGILGTTGALRLFLDDAVEHGLRWSLAPGSRLMDTGGDKGAATPLPRALLLRRYEATFDIAPAQVVNEYGMTELASQFYAGPEGVMQPPPWVRTLVLDAETLRPAAPGEPGLLRHYDLANLHTVMAIQTDDVGIRRAGGFELLGRAPGAPPRGCSLAVEALRRSERS